MSKHKIIGVVALVLAVVAAYMGYAQSQGLGSSLSSAINANPSDNVMIKYGIAVVLSVIAMVLVKK